MSQPFCIEKNFLVLCFHKMNFPVFPLNGAILFPNTNLPLNIFEDRYVDMVDYALSNNRLIGMIQTQENKDCFTIGCLGKITNFTETSDGRYQINLEGINRFKIKKILNKKHKFIIIDGEEIEYNSNYLFKLTQKELEEFQVLMKNNQFLVERIESLEVSNVG